MYSRMLRLAYSRSDIGHNAEFAAFCEQNKWWLDDFALFMAVKDRFEGKPWIEWAEDIRLRWQNAMDYYRRELYFEVEYYKYLQFKFDQQWRALKAYANEKGIRIIGDIPIYVALDSADAWANPQMFQLDEDNIPTAVAGVPPDGFSPTGQLWGNPLYRWEKHRETGYQWWITRLWYCFELYDVVRIDHFRGLESYWEIPADSETALNGKWGDGPKDDFFETLIQSFGEEPPIIAEDLGIITDEVRALRDKFGLPGMKILQFAFEDDDSNYLPYNQPYNCVCYTGTHDNDTTKAWYYGMNDWAREYSKAYLNNYDRPWEDIPWDFIWAAEASVADLAVIPMWDLLCCGSEGRMNHPSTLGENWKWRMLPGEFREDIIGRLRWLTDTFQRMLVPPKTEEEQEENKVSLRSRYKGDEGQVALDDFIADITEEIRTKEIRKIEVEEPEKK